MKDVIRFLVKSEDKKRLRAIANYEGVTLTAMFRDFAQSKLQAYSEASKVKTAP